MAGKTRALRRIDEKLPLSGGADILAVASEAAPPAPPAIPAPQFLRVTGTYLELSAVTPRAGARLAWQPPTGARPDSYQIQWATDSGFTTPTTLTAGAGQTTADIGGLPVSTAVYFRIRGVVRLVTGAWSNTASTTTPNDTTPPDPPVIGALYWSGATGALLIRWANPTSPNFRDVRVRVYASNGGALLREAFVAGTSFTYELAMNVADTSGSPDPSVYLVLTARSWSNVYSTDATTTATLTTPAGAGAVPVAWDAATGDLTFTWTQGTNIAGYRLTLDGVARDIGLTNRYVYSFGLNAAEHGGTADPSISYSLVAVDALGQTGPPVAGTANSPAPSAPASVTLAAGFSTLTIRVTPAGAYRTLRYRLIQTSPGAADVTWDSPADLATRAIGASATYQAGVRAVNMFGQTSAETLSSAVAVDTLTLADLRLNALYSDSVGNPAATLKAALADDAKASGGVSYSSSASAWRWTQVERPVEDRYRTITAGRFAMASGNAGIYFALSLDGAAWTWYAGPTTVTGDRALLTAVASEAAAQAAAIGVTNATTITRWDLPSFVDARFIRLYHRHTTQAYTLREFYPRRLVQSDDIEAEAIQAINVAAGAITADKISVSSLSAISADLGTITAGSITGVTITGATVQTAASGARLELTTANGLRTFDSGGTALVQLAAASGLTINADAASASGRAVRWVFGTEESRQYRTGSLWAFEHEVTSLLPGRIELSTRNETTLAVSGVYISQDPINSTGFGNSVTIAGAGLRVGTLTGSVASGDLSVENGLNIGQASGAAAGTMVARLFDSVTSGASTMLTLTHGSTGTPAANFGTTLLFQLQSTTTPDRNAAAVVARWGVATDASRQGLGQLLAYDASAGREALRWGTTGSAATLGFYGSAGGARPAVTGSRGGNAALASLLTELATLGLITNSTTA